MRGFFRKVLNTKGSFSRTPKFKIWRSQKKSKLTPESTITTIRINSFNIGSRLITNIHSINSMKPKLRTSMSDTTKPSR